MKIALLGYGKMGKMVETIARQEGWQIGPILDIDDNVSGSGISKSSMAGVDVAIDFSQPDAVLANIEAAAGAGVNLVVGTTGWLSEMERVREWVRQSGIGMVYGSNFSVGMNLLFELVRRAAQMTASTRKYDPFICEQHHRAKLDAPSGTALSLKRIVEPHFPGRDVTVACTRAGAIPGNHQVGFDSDADTIILEHRARSRQGLAEGAVLAARWVAGKKGLHDFHDVFAQILGM
jgi:4-hydroxy-tetrahydrodipicolinate reductase